VPPETPLRVRELEVTFRTDSLNVTEIVFDV
jgi:hypothetical protein